MQRPSVDEIHKFHSVMKGCREGSIEEKWIKKMLNWDLFTNPETNDFNSVVLDKEKLRLSQNWQKYISDNNLWISFFEWKKSSQKAVVQMMGESSEIPPKHKWKSKEGQTVESNSTFPPFKGIILEDNNRQVKAVPLLLSEEAIHLFGIDRRV